jgi:hypothetical protein
MSLGILDRCDCRRRCLGLMADVAVHCRGGGDCRGGKGEKVSVARGSGCRAGDGGHRRDLHREVVASGRCGEGCGC